MRTWQVSASSNVKKVAGKLAHSTREGNPPAVLAIGPESLNLAIKVSYLDKPSTALRHRIIKRIWIAPYRHVMSCAVPTLAWSQNTSPSICLQSECVCVVPLTGCGNRTHIPAGRQCRSDMPAGVSRRVRATLPRLCLAFQICSRIPARSTTTIPLHFTAHHLSLTGVP